MYIPSFPPIFSKVVYMLFSESNFFVRKSLRLLSVLQCEKMGFVSFLVASHEVFSDSFGEHEWLITSSKSMVSCEGCCELV